MIKDFIIKAKRKNRVFRKHTMADIVGVEDLKDLLNDFREEAKEETQVRDFKNPRNCPNSALKGDRNSNVNMSYEDDQFTQSLQKKFRSPIKQSSNRRFQRDRIHSNSVFERKLRPQFLDFQMGKESSNKRFKQSEAQSIDSAPNLVQSSSLAQSSLPFISNIKISPSIITQMLIKRLSKNNELAHLNDICRILPDTAFNKPRSHSQQI